MKCLRERKKVVWKWWHFLVWEKICLRDRGNGRCHSSGQFYLASSLCPFRFFLCTDWFDYRFWSSNSFSTILLHRVGKNVSKIVLCSLILLFIVASRNGIGYFLLARACEQTQQNFTSKFLEQMFVKVRRISSLRRRRAVVNYYCARSLVYLRHGDLCCNSFAARQSRGKIGKPTAAKN